MASNLSFRRFSLSASLFLELIPDWSLRWEHEGREGERRRVWSRCPTGVLGVKEGRRGGGGCEGVNGETLIELAELAIGLV